MAPTESSPVAENGSTNGYGGPRPTGQLTARPGGRTVDLRSDTLTLPTPAMRAAMADAAVGDDVYGEDATAIELQDTVAKMSGKEAGLFVSSGTMGNLIALLVHCELRGSEAIMGSESHIRHYEQGNSASVGGIFGNVVANKPDGTMDLRELEAAISPDDLHCAITRVICLENSHNRCGGRAVSAEYTDKLGELAKQHGLKFHIDGARIFNAATALGVSVERLVRSADSVSICLSKGLGAPLGSVLVGTREFIAKALRQRKVLGGAMRQIGVVCAPGLIAVRDMSKRLGEDHRNARALAEKLNKIPGLRVDLDAVETNIVNVEVTSESSFGAQEIVDSLAGLGVFALSLYQSWIRLVTCYHITADDVEYAVSSIKTILARPAV